MLPIVPLLLAATCIAYPSGGASETAGPIPSAVHLSVAPTPNPAQLRVQFENTKDEALILSLGLLLDNGRKQIINDVSYTLEMPDRHRLHLQIETPPVAGWMAPFLLPLPSGAAFSYLFDLRECVSAGNEFLKLEFPSGHYAIQADYSVTTTDPVFKRTMFMLWTGHIVSAALSFTLPAKITQAHHP